MAAVKNFYKNSKRCVKSGKKEGELFIAQVDNLSMDVLYLYRWNLRESNMNVMIRGTTLKISVGIG